MKMTKKEFDFLANKLEEHNLSFVEYNDENYQIKIGKGPMFAGGGNLEAGNAATTESSNGNLIEVRVPIVGNIYYTKSPGEPAFVKVGDEVKVGDVIAIVEAMKVMNEVKSEFAGIVEEICVESGSFVDANTVIMKLK